MGHFEQCRNFFTTASSELDDLIMAPTRFGTSNSDLVDGLDEIRTFGKRLKNKVPVLVKQGMWGRRGGKLVVQPDLQSPRILIGDLMPLNEPEGFAKVGLANRQSRAASI